MSKNMIRLIKALVSLCFFGLLFSFINTQQFVQTVRAMDLYYFVLSMLLALVMVASSCLKWKVSVRLTGMEVKFGRLCGIYLIGYYFSNLLPSNIGGDVVRSYYLGRSEGSQSKAAASVFIERFSGILLLLLLTVIMPVFHADGYRSPYLFVPALGAAGLLVIFLALLLIRSPLELLRVSGKTIQHCLRQPAGGWLDRGFDRVLKVVGGVYEKIAGAVRAARVDRYALLKMIFLTVWFYLLTWVNVYLAFRTFGVFPTFIQVASVTPTIMMVSMIPVSLGSLGLAEGAYVLYFSMIGMEPSTALAVGLFMRFKVLLIGSVGAFFYLMHRHEVSRDMLQQAEADKHA